MVKQMSRLREFPRALPHEEFLKGAFQPIQLLQGMRNLAK